MPSTPLTQQEHWPVPAERHSSGQDSDSCRKYWRQFSKVFTYSSLYDRYAAKSCQQTCSTVSRLQWRSAPPPSTVHFANCLRTLAGENKHHPDTVTICPPVISIIRCCKFHVRRNSKVMAQIRGGLWGGSSMRLNAPSHPKSFPESTSGK